VPPRRGDPWSELRVQRLDRSRREIDAIEDVPGALVVGELRTVFALEVFRGDVLDGVVRSRNGIDVEVHAVRVLVVDHLAVAVDSDEFSLLLGDVKSLR